MAREWGEGLNRGVQNFITAFQQARADKDAKDFRDQQFQQGLLRQQSMDERQAEQDAFEREKFDYTKSRDEEDRKFRLKEIEERRKGMLNAGLLKPGAPEAPTLPSGQVYADPIKQLDYEKKLSEIQKAKQAREIPGFDTSAATASDAEISNFRKALSVQKENEVLAKQMEALIKKHGPTPYGDAAREMSKLHSNMITNQNKIEELGALAKDDATYLKNIIGGDPTDLGAAVGASPLGQMFGATSAKDYERNYRDYGQKSLEKLIAKGKAYNISQAPTAPVSPGQPPLVTGQSAPKSAERLAREKAAKAILGGD